MTNRIQLKHPRIYIVGFMGSGKTTAGEKLASKLSCEYLDLDHYIEIQEKHSINTLFEQYGEEYFRKRESEDLRGIPDDKNYVISTGGGAPCFYNNMDFMNNTGVTVYLKMKPEQLFSRLKHGREERPLIKKKDDDELLEYIRRSMEEREKYYSQAQWIVDGFNLNINDLHNNIQQKFTE